MRRRVAEALAAAFAALLLAACGTPVTNPVTGREERTVMDEAAEIEEGRKAHQEVIAEMGAVADAKLQAYVNGVGQKLAKLSHRPQLAWTFTVVDSPQINAFALPGGYVYITRGIMAYLDSEADLAGVLGHEIGHVTARHGAQRATREQNAGVGVFAATVLGAVLEAGGLRGAGQMAQEVSQGVAAGRIAAYSREQELQADQLGAEYLSRAQYDPKNMVDVIALLRSQEQFAAESAKADGRPAPGGTNWLSSHPSNEQRLQQIREAAAKYQGRYGDDGRARYLAAIDGMTFGDGRAQGVTRGQRFYHEGLGITLAAPPGYAVRNESAAVGIVNAAGDAALVLQPVPGEAGTTHDEIVRNVFKPTQAQVERLTLNGLAASRYAGQRTSQQGAQQAFEVTLVTGPQERIYAMRGVARDAAALQRARPALREAEASFRAMTAADRNAARPWVVKTGNLPAGGLSELARRSPLPHAEGHLRLLNGAYGGGAEPRAGQRIKFVE
ncbi:MAG: M48 family metalloprotease [Burkholderiaceae bacterium]